MTQHIVHKLWSFSDVNPGDGISYFDDVTEFVLLLFINMELENVEA